MYVFDIRTATDVTDVYDLARGIADTASGCSVSGSAWANDYLRRVRSAGLGSLISQAPSQEKLRFGDGRVVPATETIAAPTVIANLPMVITWHSVDGLNFPLLLGHELAPQPARDREPLCDHVPQQERALFGRAQAG